MQQLKIRGGKTESEILFFQELTSERSLAEILQYFTVYGLESDSKNNTSNEQQFYLVNKNLIVCVCAYSKPCEDFLPL